MSYGPDGLAPKNLAEGYMSGAVGSSLHAALGVLVLLITIPFGLLLIADGDLLQGIGWIGGGVAITVTLFGLAARRDRKMNLTSSPAWYLDKHNLAISLVMMMVGLSLFLIGRTYGHESNFAVYTGGLGVAVFLVALLWFSLSVRD